MKINTGFIYPSIPIMMDNIYFAIRNFLIDKIEIEGFDNVVSQIVESIYNFRDEGNKIVQRRNKLFISIHTKSEIRKIVTSNLKHYLTGFSVQNKKNIKYSGSNWAKVVEILIGGYIVNEIHEHTHEYLDRFVDWINTPNEVAVLEFRDSDGTVVMVVVYDDGSTLTYWVEMAHS